MVCSEGGRALVRAGKMGGNPALCILDDFTRRDFDRNRTYDEISTMGVSKAMLDSLLEQYNRE